MDRQVGVRGQQGQAGRSTVAHPAPKDPACHGDGDAPVPPIMQVINDAYHLAQQRRYLSFALTEVPDNAAGPDSKRDNA